MRHIDGAERRRRLLVRHHLAASAATVEAVAGDLVGLHSTDPASVVLSARARLDPFAVGDLEDALYERRTLLRLLAMRRTMFVAPIDLAAVMNASCTRALVPGEQQRLAAMLVEAGVTDDPDGWIERVEAAAVDALRAAGEPLPASTLSTLVPELGLQLRVAVGKRYEGTVGVSTRILFLAAARGLIARGRPRGSWLSTQYRWAPMDEWVGPLPDLDARCGPRRARRPAGCARTDRAPSTTSHGGRSGPSARSPRRSRTPARSPSRPTPATIRRRRRSSWPTTSTTRRRCAAPTGAPPVALLPSLDPTIMGWKHRTWYLGPHRAPLFDRTGNAGPTVWVGGRAVGAWSQREGGEVVTRLLEDVPKRDQRRVDAAAGALTAWMDGMRVTPRFSTPLERELAVSR